MEVSRIKAKNDILRFRKTNRRIAPKIQELRHVQTEESALDISKEIDTLERKSSQLLKNIYGSLTPWQISQVARHPESHIR